MTDVYFLAGYFGLMEVVVDEIKRLTYLKARSAAAHWPGELQGV